MTNSHSKHQELSGYLDEAIENLKEEAVNWRDECAEDIASEGYPLGDGKELRRAEKWIRNLFESQRTESQLQLLDKLEKVNDKSLGESWLVIDDFITNKRQELAETGDYMSEDKEHTHRASRRSYEHHALFCRCGAFRNEVGKWVEPKDQTTLDQTGKEQHGSQTPNND